MTTIGEAFLKILPDTKDFGREVEANVGKEIAGAGDALTKKLTPVAAVVAGTAHLISNAYREGFETIVAGSGLSGKALEGLVDSAKNVAGQVTVSFGDVSAVLTEVYQRTKLVGEPLEALTKQIVDLAEVTGIDAVGSVETFVKVLGAWKIETEDQAAALDLMFRAAQNTGTSIIDIATNASTARPIMQQLGFDFEETAALAAKLGGAFPQVFAGIKVGLANLSKDPDVRDIPARFEEIITSIEGAGSAAAANRIAIETFGSRAGPLLATRIREGALGIADFTAQLRHGERTIEGTRDATETFIDRLIEVKNGIIGVIGPSAEWLAIIADIATGIGPVISITGRLVEVISGLSIAEIANSTVAVALGVAYVDLAAIVGSTAAAIAVSTAVILAAVAAVGLLVLAIMESEKAQHLANEAILAGIPTIEAYEKNAERGIHTRQQLVREIANQVAAAKDEGASEEELTAIREAGRVALGKYDDAMRGTIDVTRRGARRLQEFAGLSGQALKDWKVATTNSLNFVSEAFGRIGNKAKLTADKVIGAFRRQIDNIVEFKDNISTLADRGLSQFAAQTLAGMGTAGAAIADALVEGPRSAAKEFSSSLGRATSLEQGFADDVVRIFNPLPEKFHGYGKNMGDQLAAGIRESTPGVRAAWKELTDLIPGVVHIPDVRGGGGGGDNGGGRGGGGGGQPRHTMSSGTTPTVPPILTPGGGPLGTQPLVTTNVIVEGRVLEEGKDRHRRKVGGRTT